ncbi:MAG: hypothetical protein QW035_03730 [Candidatus Anstonellales archaeon]
MKKAQASIEYLMTYGWAILAIVLILGYIMVSGIFSPASFLPEQCSINEDISCTGHALIVKGENSEVRMSIRNRFSSPVKIASVSIKAAGDSDWKELSPNSVFLSPGQEGLFTGVLQRKLSTGQVSRLNILVKYAVCPIELGNECSSEITATGEMITRPIQG